MQPARSAAVGVPHDVALWYLSAFTTGYDRILAACSVHDARRRSSH